MRDYEEKSYYEIQLDNKQLILVFLAAITVCVLIFVLGIMIGKGQKEAELAAAGKNESAPVRVEPDVTPPSEALAQEPGKNSESKPVSEPKAEKQYAFEELDKTEEPVANEPAEKEAAPSAQESDNRPGKAQFTVQVMATSSREKAQEQLTKLKAKGYSPFLREYQTEMGNVYKVRVGRFSDSAAAKELASRLRKDLQLETWVAIAD